MIVISLYHYIFKLSPQNGIQTHTHISSVCFIKVRSFWSVIYLFDCNHSSSVLRNEPRTRHQLTHKPFDLKINFEHLIHLLLCTLMSTLNNPRRKSQLHFNSKQIVEISYQNGCKDCEWKQRRPLRMGKSLQTLFSSRITKSEMLVININGVWLNRLCFPSKMSCNRSDIYQTRNSEQHW